MKQLNKYYFPIKQKGNSIIEVMVIIMVITVWLVWAYSILNSWTKLTITTENRIKATNIAREWMELTQNIRDTNWIKFSSDITNCWNVLNYNSNCIWDSTHTNSMLPWSYIAVQSWSLWYLSWTYAPNASFGTYIKQFPIYFDDNWLISQNWNATRKCDVNTSTWCVSIFSREIIINYPDTWTPLDKRIQITSRVRWVDSSRTWAPYEINLSTIFTNWKEKL